jgi:hypothetical protein
MDRRRFLPTLRAGAIAAPFVDQPQDRDGGSAAAISSTRAHGLATRSARSRSSARPVARSLLQIEPEDPNRAGETEHDEAPDHQG